MADAKCSMPGPSSAIRNPAFCVRHLKCMTDQAERLRELVQAAPLPACQAAPGLPMIVVAGGKRGVGSSTVAVNLAAALTDRGERVVVVDVARHRADMAQVAGITSIGGSTVGDVLSGKTTAAEALVSGPGARASW